MREIIMVLASAQLPQPPDLSKMDWLKYLSIREFLKFWTVSTYGIFPYVLAGLAIAGVYMKTRSASLTALTAILLLVLSPMLKWLSIVVALLLAWLLYRAIYRKNQWS